MEYVKLGDSDLMVSKVCLGCMSFGEAQKGIHSWTLPYEESKKIIKYALDNGINFFDTAMGYQGGTSEEFLGKAIKEYAKREDVIIATKFIPRTQEEVEQGIDAKEHIENCLNESLKRLNMDYVDLYILHMWDYNTPIEDIMEALHDVIKQGKVRYIGISNCYSWQIAKANEIAKAKGYEQFVSIQGHYNLIFREEEREMKPYCTDHNIAMTPYSALASGRLAKHPGEQSKRLSEDNYAKGKYDRVYDEDLAIINRVEELAEKKGVSMTEISLAWLFTKVTSPIIGATKLHHIDGAVKATSVGLTDEEIIYLEELYKPHRLVGVMAENK
ncbi:MAG: aldo/keto reductase [Clostridium butyricum]|nr:aldo/keto reductase [Clostridium butyricum]